MRRKNPSFSYEECQGVVLREEEKEMKKRIVFHPGDHVGITVCSNGLKREQKKEIERLRRDLFQSFQIYCMRRILFFQDQEKSVRRN